MNSDPGAPADDPDGQSDETAAALQSLFAEVVGLFHRSRVLAEQLHGQDGMTGGSRSILVELDRSGPRTMEVLEE